jgi:hypothetical protein
MMAKSKNEGWGAAIATGLFVGFLSTFQTFRILFLIIVSIALSTFLWDSWWTSKVLTEDQYEFSVSTPMLDEMDGNRPADISPMFRINWKFVNNSEYLVETAELSGILYRCDSYDQPLQSCDYIRREDHIITLNLPAGRHTTRDDQFSFIASGGTPGIYRAEITTNKVYADTDREY